MAFFSESAKNLSNAGLQKLERLPESCENPSTLSVFLHIPDLFVLLTYLHTHPTEVLYWALFTNFTSLFWRTPFKFRESCFKMRILCAVLLVLCVCLCASGGVAIPSLSTRNLAIGDFDIFNEAIKDLTFNLEDPGPIVQQILFELRIQLTNVYCVDINIGDAQGDYTMTSNQELTYTLDLEPFAMTCYADYSYTYGGFIRSSGTALVVTGGNAVELGLGFESSSTDFELAPPNRTTLKTCVPQLEVTNIEFSGVIEGVVARIFQTAVADAVEVQAGTGTYRGRVHVENQ